MSHIPINYNLQLQSPYLYCNAAGSDGSDRTKEGIHLRWDLLKELGENHIPKGNLARSNVGFNKPEDFVALYRAPYDYGGRIVIEVNGYNGSNIEMLPNYSGIVLPLQHGGNSLNLHVRFLNRALFKSIIEAGLDPNDPVQDFLNRYDGIIELEIPGKLLFSYGAEFTATGSGDAIFETVSTPDRLKPNEEWVIKREFKDGSDLISNGVNTIGENISTIRIRQRGMPKPFVVYLHTYEDFFDHAQQNDRWEKIGDFSLSVDDNEVMTWFQGEPYGGGSPNLSWPKYNDGAEVVGDNYLDRWQRVGGLKENVLKYISLSDTDPRAYINYASGDPGDDNAIAVSLLDMLKMVTLDYHGARMLGLGYLDPITGKEGEQYVYAAVYTTLQPLPQLSQTDHVCLTLPTSMRDYRLPLPPETGLNYGLYVSTDEGTEPDLLSDSEGYSFYSDERYINLERHLSNVPQPKQSTIPEDSFFDTTTITQPFSFGVEYRREGEGDWQRPELLRDDEYDGSDGFRETTTTPEKDSRPLYTHRETEAGVHEYALYSVNWFSRVSGLSNIAVTDDTRFPRRNTLLPPFNLAVQYIQEEDPLIFTTQSEQDDLTALNASNPAGDNYKTRVTFEWDNIHNNAYQSADKVEFFYRSSSLQKVDGKIKAVSSLSDSECLVTTTSFQMTSVNPVITVMPVIPAGQESRFIGSLLCTPEGQYEVLSIAQPSIAGDGPSFIVKKNRSNEAVQPNPTDPVSVSAVYTSPEAGNIFFVFENSDNPAQWTQLMRTVNLISFSNQTETILEEDGSTHLEVVGGINAVADIQEIQGSDGGYNVLFPSGVNLNPHPDATVSWAKGSARFITAANPLKKKRLAVYSIRQTNPIQLVVYDPEYLLDPNARIQTGSQTVNFHPGYKVYLSPEPGFGKPQTMPAGNQNNKKTYIAARSKDSIHSLHSSLTQPAILVARNIQKPIAPQNVQGPLYATRPDVYEKSTYTLDIQLNTQERVPYGVVVYRSTEMALLQALYAPDTVRTVLEQLAAIASNDPSQYDRWRSLMEAEPDPNDANEFKLFGAYRFPRPDNTATTVYPTAQQQDSFKPFAPFSGSITANRTVLKRVIEDTFTPLTEVPVVFDYLKTGYQTSSTAPKTRDLVGRLLSPNDPAFDPFPMAVKYPSPNPNTVRFTDYTLEGSARNLYFYFAREVAVDTKLSPRTTIWGPVKLVDSSPAEKPVVRKVVTREADPILQQSASVIFDVAQYIDSENIRKYQVFRTTDIGKATTPRTMQLAKTVDVGDEVLDDFSNLSFPPYGEPLYYRLVALREITNEQDQLEMVPSKPSEMLLTNVIDVINPEAPQITPTIGGTITNTNGQVTALTNVSLSWPQTVYNGTYYLYKMNSKGNWEKLWSKKTNSAQVSFPENGDFTTWPQTANLSKLDDEGNVIYHRFKVSVENASGLFNLEDEELVL